LKRLLLFAFLLFFIFIGVTRDWVNVRISLQDFHSEVNARALALKLRATSTNRKRDKKQENTDYRKLFLLINFYFNQICSLLIYYCYFLISLR
jgi:hypothetical protein